VRHSQGIGNYSCELWAVAGAVLLQDGVELASQLTSAEMHADADRKDMLIRWSAGVGCRWRRRSRGGIGMN